ncbi:hypothetical protein [Microbacterium sp. MPKO10]|uniref:hypothetical protein n=1 Tax=Microbacterium sp. MPKO10 TaxID=2989818 RepID=UPI0022357590|nr:hypothetical protein [Microbacterium sp. MPKO10]MCW4457018.1 hypothetical protein [Microbacterium sp. MPKO10]
MNRTQLKTIIVEEGFIDAVFLDEQPIREDSVVLERRESDWTVYLTIDRGMIVDTTFRTFTTEEQALNYMLVKLRQTAQTRRLFAGGS